MLAPMEYVADESVVFVLPDGQRTPGRIAIGCPMKKAEACTCELWLDGLEPQRTIYGDSTLQAVSLALRFAHLRLEALIEAGGRVVFEDDGDVPLDALFGPLDRNAGERR